MKKTNKNTSNGMLIGMCLGLSIGTALGASVLHNVSLGMCLGMSIGMSLGVAFGSVKDNAVNEQIASKGYTIKSISGPNKDNQYELIIVDLDGKDQIHLIDKGIMDEENFKVGDMVYIDEEGNIEQAYDEEEDEE